MAYQNTLYKLNDKLINLLKANGFNTITTGDENDYDQQKRDVQYPQAHIILDGGTIQQQTTELNFKIMLMDKLDTSSNEFIEYGNDNFIDIQQDLMVRFSTVLSQLDKKYLTTYDSNFIGNEFNYNVVFAYFKETQPELLGGVVANLTITVPLMVDDCATYYSIEGMPSRPQNYTDYSHTLFVQTELKTIENTTTETSLIGNGIGNRSILANKLYLGKTYQSNIKGLISGVKGDTATIRIKIGNQTIIQNIAEIPATLNNTYFESNLTYLCVGITGTTAQILCEGKTTILGGVGLNTTYSRSLVMLAPITIDNSIDNLIDVTYQWSVASALNKLTNTMAELEEIN